MSLIPVKNPPEGFLERFLMPSLFSTKGYQLDAPQVGIKLDQNESPWDWPDSVKDAVLRRLKNLPWNRYPAPFADELVIKIAAKNQVSPDCVMLGPGSNYLVALILQTFSRKIQGKVVVARPSFALYESHCSYEGIPFESWPLDSALEYDETLLPQLPNGSMVVFASPNNPVGNVLSVERLESLLIEYPNVLWVGDEAYCEFSKDSYAPLLGNHSNLIIVRTFSKTLGAAGIRLGYVMASPIIIELLKKPRVPFLLNQFSIAAALEVFENADLENVFKKIIQNAISERTRVATNLKEVGLAHGFQVKSSEANFVLVRWPSTEQSTRMYNALVAKGILVRNVAKAPGLAGCLRISIGTEQENNSLLCAFLEIAQNL